MDSTVTKATTNIITHLTQAAETLVQIITTIPPENLDTDTSTALVKVMEHIRRAQDTAHNHQQNLHE